MKQTQQEGENVRHKDGCLLMVWGEQSYSYYYPTSYGINLCLTPFTEKKILYHISLQHNVSMYTAYTEMLLLNGKEEQKVKDRLPTEITIYHLHLISHHMAVKTCVTAQVEVFIFIIL